MAHRDVECGAQHASVHGAAGVAQMRRERQCDRAGLLVVGIGDRKTEEVNEEIPAELRLGNVGGATRRRDGSAVMRGSMVVMTR